MRERSCPLLLLGLCFVVAAFSLSCDSGGSDDGDTTIIVTNNVEAPAPTPDPEPEPSAQELGSGDKSVLAGGAAVSVGPYTAPGAGAVTATITWGEATQITAFFKKGGPENFGWVNGDSPLNSTAEPVAADDVLTLYLVNSGGVNASAHVTVTYVP